MIYVTKPFLPPQSEYLEFLNSIWQRNVLTNNGPLVLDLEKKLKEYLGLEHLLFVTNGTIAIQLAIKALQLKGKIITTPFSYVATTSSIVWENCEPVFSDIDPDTLNIDPEKIPELIDKDTTAILATHCFGNACNIPAIEKIAKEYNLKVIYDAAHAFGTRYNDKSIFAYGDISVTSFHATKLFHTIEGGAIFTKNAAQAKLVSYLRNFGHDGPEKFNGVGINGKNSEFHAAMGLSNLKYIDAILKSRKDQSLYYTDQIEGLDLKTPRIQAGCDYNYSYYPVIFSSESVLLRVKQKLEENKIFTRRYFYPSLSSLSYVKPYATPISDDISRRILCLPIYFDLRTNEQDLICSLIRESINK